MTGHFRPCPRLSAEWGLEGRLPGIRAVALHGLGSAPGPALDIGRLQACPFSCCPQPVGFSLPPPPGECVIALKSMIGSTAQQFLTYLSHRGEETGNIRGSMKVRVPAERMGTRERLYGEEEGEGLPAREWAWPSLAHLTQTESLGPLRGRSSGDAGGGRGGQAFGASPASNQGGGGVPGALSKAFLSCRRGREGGPQFMPTAAPAALRPPAHPARSWFPLSAEWISIDKDETGAAKGKLPPPASRTNPEFTK